MHKKRVSVAGYGLNLEISAPYSCRCAWKVGVCVFTFGRQQFRGYSEVFMLTCLFCDARSSRPGKGAAGSDQLALGGLSSSNGLQTGGSALQDQEPRISTSSSWLPPSSCTLHTSGYLHSSVLSSCWQLVTPTHLFDYTDQWRCKAEYLISGLLQRPQLQFWELCDLITPAHHTDISLHSQSTAARVLRG